MLGLKLIHVSKSGRNDGYFNNETNKMESLKSWIKHGWKKIGMFQ